MYAFFQLLYPLLPKPILNSRKVWKEHVTLGTQPEEHRLKPRSESQGPVTAPDSLKEHRAAAGTVQHLLFTTGLQAELV